jgi:hypothetical protein
VVSLDVGVLSRLDEKIASTSKPETTRNTLLGSGTGVPAIKNGPMLAYGEFHSEAAGTAKSAVPHPIGGAYGPAAIS